MKTKHQPAIGRLLKVRWMEKNWCPKISRRAATFILPVEIPCSPKNMKHISTRASLRGFTLIELLTVIAIIAILAGLLLPAFGRVKLKTQVAASRNNIQGIVAAISQYYADYSRYPTGPSAQVASDPTAKRPDFTYGTVYNFAGIEEAPAKTTAKIGNAKDEDDITFTTGYQFSNAEVMAILLDQEFYREKAYPSQSLGASGRYETINLNHARNPRKKNSYLDGKFVDDTKLAGIGPDLVYRDPWGNPYIITLDLNYDGRCRDALYRRAAVSQNAGPAGFNGLNNTADAAGTPGNNYEYEGGAMAWSLGPDSSIEWDKTANTKTPDRNGNTDNILSW